MLFKMNKGTGSDVRKIVTTSPVNRFNTTSSSIPSISSWYNKVTGLIYPDVIVDKFDEVIQWQ